MEMTEQATSTSRWEQWRSREHVGFALTLGYIFLAAVGMLHRAIVFLSFRINVVDYAEPSDFLLAALRDPLIVLACVAPVPLVWLYFRFGLWLRKFYKDNKYLSGGERGRQFFERHRTTLFLVTTVLWSVAFSLSYANSVARDLRAGKGRRVQVDLINGTLLPPSDTTKLLLVGTTQKYLFLYDDRTRTTSVIPNNNISRIRYVRPPVKR